MAILGGAGNPVGGSFTGPAEALEVIGNHHYAISGSISFTDSGEATMIDTQTGNYYSKTLVQFGVPSATSGDVTTRVYFNGVQVMGHETNDSASALLLDALRLVIPPYTDVKVTIQLSSGSSTAFCMMTGRIYRTRD